MTGGSYLGQDVFGYEPYMTVDNVAEYTDMMTGAESLENQQIARKRSVKESPAKSLLMFWVFLLLLYSLLNFIFRRHMA